MTMDQLYLPITLVLVVAAGVRLPAAWRSPAARPAWFATLAAVPALLSRGAVVPIETLDAWMGGENLIFLVQCWFTIVAFWFLAEAATVDPSSDPDPMLPRLWIPACLGACFTVPFFFIAERRPTELFFIDAHVDDLAAVVCGATYMGVVVGIASLLIWRLRNRRGPGHWLFRCGAVLICLGSGLWVSAIVLHYALSLDRAQILWMYLGFDVLFYPGVVIMAGGLLTFATIRRVRAHSIRRQVRDLSRLLEREGITPDNAGTSSAHALQDLMIQVEDLKAIRAIRTTEREEAMLRDASLLLRRLFPDPAEISQTRGEFVS